MNYDIWDRLFFTVLILLLFEFLVSIWSVSVRMDRVVKWSIILTGTAGIALILWAIWAS